MATLNVVDGQNKKVSTVEFADAILSEKINKAVLHAAVRMNLAGLHHGTVDTKTRAEVNRTGKKVYKQKGTGGARHGSRKSSPFVGGGRVFGPHPRDFSLGMNKKVKQLALKEAIRSKLQSNSLSVVKSFPFKEIKTKLAADFFKALGLSEGLVIIEKSDEKITKSIRNLIGFKVVLPNQLKVFDLLKYKNTIISELAFEEVSKRYFV